MTLATDEVRASDTETRTFLRELESGALRAAVPDAGSTGGWRVDTITPSLSQ